MPSFSYSSDSGSGSEAGESDQLKVDNRTWSHLTDSPAVQDPAKFVKELEAKHRKAQAAVDQGLGDQAAVDPEGRDDLLSLLGGNGAVVQDLFDAWQGVHTTVVVQVLTCLGPADHEAFFRSLVLHVPHPDTRVTRQPMSLVIDARDGNFSFGEDGIDDRLLHPAGRQAEFQQITTDLIEGTQEVCTSYTQTRSLLRCHDDEDLIFMLYALIESSNNAFDTVWVHCIVSEAWKNCSHQFAFDRACDVALITALAFVAQFGRLKRVCHCEQGTCHPDKLDSCDFVLPPWLELWLLAVVVLMTCGCMLRAALYTAGAVRVFGWRRGLLQTFSHWGLAMTLCEVFTSCVVLYLAGEYAMKYLGRGGEQQVLVTEEHPVITSFVVLARWLQLVFSLMSTGLFGGTVLPAFNAVISPSSARFLVFLAIFWCGCVHAYFVFPITGELDFNTLISSFTKVFRLAFLGDFDLWELEGKDTKVVMTFQNGTRDTLQGSMGDPEVSDFFHLGLQLYFVGVSCFFTILMMNVYIGVLGNEYNEQKVNSRAGTLKLRAQVLVQLLEVREMLPFTRRLSAAADAGQHGDYEGLWILWAPEAVGQAQEDQEAAELESAVGSLEAKLDRMEKMVADVCRLDPLTFQRGVSGY